MKLPEIIAKNIKVLFRSKGTAVMTIIGPLLVILLVGLAFNNAKSFDVSVGVYTPDNSPLSQSFVENLKKDQFSVTSTPSEDSCVDMIKQGAVHTCIIFPWNFRIENQKVNSLIIYVDNSRQNIVYQVMTSLNKNINVKEEELSLGMTNTILSALFLTRDEINTDILRVINTKKGVDNQVDSLDLGISDLNMIDLEATPIDLSPVTTSAQDLQFSVKEVHDKGIDIVREGLAFASEVEENTTFEVDNFTAALGLLQAELDTMYNVSPTKLHAMLDTIEAADESLKDIEQRLTTTQTTIQGVTTRFNAVRTDLGRYKGELDTVQTSLERSVAAINTIKITNAENIVSPITTTIKPVSTQKSKLIFLFPNLLMLVVLFISILLAGTLIVMEKNSKAAFRNFTTPVKEEQFLLGHFLTSMIIILFQSLIILLFASFFLKSNAFVNFGTTLLVIIIAATLFILIGILVGNLFSTQEGVMMICTALGTILILLSNLVLPLEDISGMLSRIAHYNPYVLASETLKKAVLFDAPFTETIKPLAILIFYAFIVLFLVFATRDFTRKKKRMGNLFTARNTRLDPQINPLILGSAKITKIEDIAPALRLMTDAEFPPQRQNDVSIWVRGVLQDAKLGKKLEGKTREEMIAIIETYNAQPRSPRKLVFKLRKD